MINVVPVKPVDVLRKTEHSVGGGTLFISMKVAPRRVNMEHAIRAIVIHSCNAHDAASGFD